MAFQKRVPSGSWSGRIWWIIVIGIVDPAVHSDIQSVDAYSGGTLTGYSSDGEKELSPQ